ncbi:hypothetical protein [Enterococcus faecium]|uniref:hypothetical protein n=1 Tax=Enterococcus faecium TaxID=1352 RepID=UPI000DC4CC32|nr:hypothetical protein [Enterococcus faecium]RAQ24006.1 hypothetical protein DPX30_06665 [Enterococcus faecium]
MNQEELFQKVKEMIKNGNFDGAKRFIEEHKEQLGPYKEKAQNLLKDVNIDSVKNKGSIIYGTDESELILQPHFHFRY